MKKLMLKREIHITIVMTLIVVIVSLQTMGSYALVTTQESNTFLKRKISPEFQSEQEFLTIAQKELGFESASEVNERIVADMENLESCYFTEQQLKKISIVDEKLTYTFTVFNGCEAKITVAENCFGDTILEIQEGSIHNQLTRTHDNQLYVDGHKVTVSGIEASTLDESEKRPEVLPNYYTRNFQKNRPSAAPKSTFTKKMDTYKVSNVDAGVNWANLTLSVLYTVAAWSIEQAVAILVSVELSGAIALPVAVISVVMQAILSENKAAIPAKDAHLSYKITVYKSTKSTGYERFYSHVGKYYSRANYKGTLYDHTFYEYQFMNTL